MTYREGLGCVGDMSGKSKTSDTRFASGPLCLRSVLYKVEYCICTTVLCFLYLLGNFNCTLDPAGPLHVRRARCS
jgi:hypothetical protein